MSLINKAQVKKATLELAAANRAHKFTRVSKEFIEMIDAEVRLLIQRKIQALPSKGKTIDV